MPKTQPIALDDSWNLEDYCAQVSSELATLTGTILGELEHGLASDSPPTRERAMAISLRACEQLLRLNHNLKYLTGALGPAEVTDLSSTLLESLDWIEKELAAKKLQFEVSAESPCVGALPHGILGLLLKNLLLSIGERLPAQSTIAVQLSQSDEHFDFTFEFQPPEGRISLEEDLSLSTARDLANRLRGKVLAQPKGRGAKLHLQFPRRDSSLETFETQRTSPRVTVTLPIVLELAGQPPVESHLRVLSRRGAYLLVPPGGRRPERDQIGSLKIHHTVGESIEILRLRVASCLWSGSEPGVGVEFLSLDSRAERILNALIRSHGKS